MEISVVQSRRLPLLMASAAAIVVAVGLILATWNSVRHQRELVMRHMILSAQAVLRSTQANLMGSLRHTGHPGQGWRMGRGVPERMGEWQAPLASELLAELTQDTDVRLLAILGANGEIISSSAPSEAWESAGLSLPTQGLEELRETGRWFLLIEHGGEHVLFMAERARPAVARFCQPMQEGRPPGRDGPPPMTYLLMGLGVEEYLAHYVEFRRTAMYQTGFILVAAASFLAFVAYYLRRREQGRAYRALQRFHDRLLDDMPDGLLSLDSQGVVRAANPAAHTILDRAPGKLVGQPLDSLPLVHVQGDEVESWAEYNLGGKRLEVLRRDLGDAGQADEIAPEPEAGSSLVLVRDRTRVKALEKRLSEAEKLAAAGRLAAGVAHEIRNPLSALRGFAQFFLGKFQGVRPEEEYARTMVREADRLNKVITDMLFLARPQSLLPQDVDIACLFAELERLLAGEAKAAEAELSFTASVSSVHADQDGLKQVLLNLIMNSLAALPQPGGRVSVTAEAAPGGTLLSVADTGRGFSPEVREHALEPFFTTRAAGTGLGLAIVHKLVQDHGGRLEIHSQEGHGAMVRVFLPHGQGPEPSASRQGNLPG